jgi:hypothetical protein
VPFVLFGCGQAPPPTESPIGPKGGLSGWRCETVEGEPSPAWLNERTEWARVNGVITGVVVSEGFDDAAQGADDRDTAVASIAGKALDMARDQLEARGAPSGVVTANSRRRAVAELVESGSADFPRLSFRDMHIERCVGPDATDSVRYRAAAIVQYPIALLRGDAANAAWERRRLAREAGLLSAAAADYLDEGRWTDAALSSGRAEEALRSAGASSVADGAAWEVDGTLLRTTVVPQLACRTVDPVTVAPRAQDVDVRVSFSFFYEWRGRERPAVGVPVSFETGLAGVIEKDAATDAAGGAGAVIRRTWSPVGSWTVTAGVDSAALAAAGALWDGPSQSATATVYVVEPGRGRSVCLDLPGADAADAAQVRAGLEQRLAEDGYALVPCGPAADALVTARLSLSAVEEDGRWSAWALLEVDAVDQTTASTLGATEILVEETTGRERRETEVLVLKEAGRLLGVYLSGRTARP